MPGHSPLNSDIKEKNLLYKLIVVLNVGHSICLICLCCASVSVSVLEDRGIRSFNVTLVSIENMTKRIRDRTYAYIPYVNMPLKRVFLLSCKINNDADIEILNFLWRYPIKMQAISHEPLAFSFECMAINMYVFGFL